MEPATPADLVVPNPRLPRMIGILNIVFAALLLAGNALSIVSMLMFPFTSRMIRVQAEQAKTRIESDRRSQVAEARAREEAAKSETERARRKAERVALERSPLPPTAPMTMGLDIMADPRMAAYTWADNLTGLLFNGAMLAAGIGLLQLREWSRKLALWVAGLKLVRILALTAFLVMVIVPTMSATMGGQMNEMIAQQAAAGGRGPAGPLPNFRNWIAIGMTAAYVGIGLLAVIWPAVQLWALTRPRARAACLADKGPGTWEPSLS